MVSDGSGGLLTIEAEGWRLVLAPEVGGSIARLDALTSDGPVPILRGAEGVPDGALEAGCFPLVPYCNRIRNGRFRFRGRTIELAPNMEGDPNPLHGQGWLAPWQVPAWGEDGARLSYDHAPGEWPWAYSAEQVFRLREGALIATLTCRNLSDAPMPCGLGFHPYQPCDSETRLTTEVAHVWTVDDDTLPVARLSVTGKFDPNAGPICGRDLDNGYDGWSGRYEVRTPGHLAYAVTSDRAGYFQLYAPPTGELFVAEPVTHANAALNEDEAIWGTLGLRVLQPGEAMTLDMTVALI